MREMAGTNERSRWAHNLLKRTSSLLKEATRITSTDQRVNAHISPAPNSEHEYKRETIKKGGHVGTWPYFVCLGWGPNILLRGCRRLDVLGKRGGHLDGVNGQLDVLVGPNLGPTQGTGFRVLCWCGCPVRLFG